MIWRWGVVVGFRLLFGRELQTYPGFVADLDFLGLRDVAGLGVVLAAQSELLRRGVFLGIAFIVEFVRQEHLAVDDLVFEIEREVHGFGHLLVGLIVRVRIGAGDVCGRT